MNRWILEEPESLSDETRCSGLGVEEGTEPGGGRSDGGATDALTPEDESACEIGDERVNKVATLHGDAAIEGDWDLHDDGDKVSSTEPIDLDDHNEVNTRDVSDINVDAADSSEGDLTELAALHRRLTRLEARLHVGTVARQATSASKKRKQSTSASPYAKRLKDNRIVNISTTRAYVYWDDSSERCAYTWTRGRGGRCWVRDEELEDREEVDGKYLTMSVENRANADWLPLRCDLTGAFRFSRGGERWKP